VAWNCLVQNWDYSACKHVEISRVTVQLLASQDDLLMVKAAAIVHEVFLDSDAVSIHEQGRECQLYWPCVHGAQDLYRMPVSSVQSVGQVTRLLYLFWPNLANWLTEFTGTDKS